MDFKTAQQKITEEISGLIRPHGFTMVKDLRLGIAPVVTFEKKDHGRTYSFFIHPIPRGYKTIGVGSGISVSFDEINLVAREIGLIVDAADTVYEAIALKINAFSDPDNPDSFFDDDNCVTLKYAIDETNLKETIKKLYDPHFLTCASTFFEKTSSIEKLDDWINGWVLKADPGEPLKPAANFSTRPWQMVTGLMVAKLANNPQYDVLEERYAPHARTEGLTMDARDFFNAVDYFKKK